ncbi:MAG: signal peptidase I [Anaerolineaceae bacterium]|nr:signal peptidase I [Anaerolineaceae bacterium]
MAESAVYMPRPRLRRRGLLYELIDTIVLIVSIYALADLASVRFYVDGRSMQPNFYTGQRVIVSRVNYMLTEPERGEIIVFESPDRPGIDAPLIKRVIGLPGEHVEIIESQVFIDGQLLDEPYINDAIWRSSCRTDTEWDLNTGQYFVMGDNRNNSRDSRCFGPVEREHVIGEALVRYWPPQDIGLIYKLHYPEDPFE